MISAEELLRNQKIYFGSEIVGGIFCHIGYIKKFRWSWVATQMNTFIIIGQTDGRIDKKMAEDFSTACLNYANKNNKGWPKGLQAAVASISVLQGKEIEPDAIIFCEEASKKHWSAFELPVIFDIEQKKGFRFKKNPIFGAIYYPYFAELIDDVINKLSK